MDIIELKKEITKNIKEKSEISIIAVSVLRGVLATAQNSAIEVRTEVTEEIINSALLKEQKTIKEMIETCPAERTDLYKEYNTKLGIINHYAPKIIDSPEKIEILIKEILDEAGLGETSEKREVMKVVMPKLKGKVDMKIASQVISKIFK